MLTGQPRADGEAIEFFACRREHVAIAEALAPRVADVLSSGAMLQGPEVAAFEAELAAMSGRRHVVCVGSGTDALFFSLLALGVGPGDEVLVPDISFVASASAVLRAGATPVFVDIDESCNLDIQAAADHVTPRTRALLFVQLFGGMSDPRSIEDFALRHRIAVLEDAAQSFSARFGHRICGGGGDISATSFDPTKAIAAPGSGGAILTDNPTLAAHVRRLRYHGKENGQVVELGFNSQLPSINAAVLSLKLGKHGAWTARRREIAAFYADRLRSLPIELPTWSPQVEPIWHKFVLKSDRRDQMAEALRGAGVPTLIHYPIPFHREKLFAPLGGRDAAYPRACAHAARALSLPIHAQLSDAEVEHIARSVVRFFG